MLKIVLNILIIGIALVGFSCVNSSMYNTSIGRTSKVTYPEETKEETPAPPASTTPVVKKEEEKKPVRTYKIVKRQVVDTVVSEKFNVEKMPINPERKDSLLFALVKNDKMSQPQKDKALQNFIESHNKKTPYLDTAIVKREVADTIYDPLPVKTDTAKIASASSNSVDDVTKGTPKLSPEEVFNLGVEDGKKYSGKRDFLYPFLYFLIPYAGFFISITIGIIRLANKPFVNWRNIESKYKYDRNYRKGYNQEARKIKNKNVLFGLIPVGVVLLIIGAIIGYNMIYW